MTRAPPLVVDGQAIEDTTEKAHALRKALLERFSNKDDLDFDPLKVQLAPKNYLPWRHHLSHEELELATIAPKNSAPGADGIPVRLLRACWEPIRELTRSLPSAPKSAA